MTFSRRGFLKRALGAGAGLTLAARDSQRAAAQAPGSQLERNKAAVIRFKKTQGTPEHEAALREVMAPDYRRVRGGIHHLANNARDQGFPGPGQYLRDAFPDRVDVMEDIIADGDRVGLLWRLTGTHKGNLFGIAPTGRKIDVYEAGIFRLAGGGIAEAWFMVDEAGLLKQLGAQLPPRKDGRLIVPEPSNAGEFGDDVLKRLTANAPVSREDHNKVSVARTKSSSPAKDYRAPDYRMRRQGFQHLRDYGNAHGVGKETPTTALPDRRDRIDDLLAEGEKVWMQFKICGTQTANLYGVPPSGRRLEAPEVGIIRIVDGKWREGWYFGDELALMLQLGALHILKG